MDLSKYLYSPAIRTRRAELLGLSHIKDSYDAGFLPLFELTRSRRTKSNPEGSVEISVREVLEIVGDAAFVVDITGLSSLTNSEVEKLLDPDASFANWVEFVDKNLPRSAVPVIHLTDPYDDAAVSHQLSKFVPRHGAVAIRVPAEFEDIELLARTVEREVGSFEHIVLYVDVGLVTEKGLRGAMARVVDVVLAVSDLNPGLVVPLASSFPSTVTPFGDEHGSFSLHEVSISDYIKGEFAQLNCIHGDYACIHPRDLEGMAINWVPRVDVPLDDSLFYYRFRRHDGGYVRAAAAALSDGRYSGIECWGDENIRLAAGGDPAGKAPAFWISVRLNLHIERQLIRLGA